MSVADRASRRAPCAVCRVPCAECLRGRARHVMPHCFVSGRENGTYQIGHIQSADPFASTIHPKAALIRAQQHRCMAVPLVEDRCGTNSLWTGGELWTGGVLWAGGELWTGGELWARGELWVGEWVWGRVGYAGEWDMGECDTGESGIWERGIRERGIRDSRQPTHIYKQPHHH